MKILFANLSSLQFNVETPYHEPLGGTESCVCYLARELAKKGHDVSLIARLPQQSPNMVAGVRHRSIALMRDKDFFDAEKFDIIITLNAALACPRFREHSPASINIFWNHLPPDQPPIEPLGHPLVQDTIDQIVYVSEWQKDITEKYFTLPKPSRVIANGLTPSFENMFASASELLAAKQNRAAYTSVPYRGLSILLDVASSLNTSTVFDIYSSMRVYQSSDDEQTALLERAKSSPSVKYHGSVSQTELATQIKAAAFLTYPCIMPETFCLSVLEALGAGMKVIATDLGGIKSTGMGFADLVEIKEGMSGEEFMRDYGAVIEKNVTDFTSNPDAWAERMFHQVQTVNRECLWAHRAKEWEHYLGRLLAQKCAIETKRSSG